MTRTQIVERLRSYRLAVVSTVSPSGEPQAAVVGIAVSDRLEIVFDTLVSTRKYNNLQRDRRIALVVGWDDEITFQIEGAADMPTGEELDRIRSCYFATYPDGRERLAWPGITHVRVRPTWIRLSDFTRQPANIVELSADELASPHDS
jgi:pyridoxine/pyridoxamine 5'-phosphate oxidase